MKSIDINTAYWHEIENKLAVCDIVKTSFQEFSLLTPDKNMFDLLVILQAYPFNFQAFKAKQFKKMRRKTKTLELYLVLDYERIMQSSDEENLAHVKTVFMQGCEKFLKPMKGFDLETFNEEIQKKLEVI